MDSQKEKIQGWTQALELLEAGELPASQVHTILEELPLAIRQCNSVGLSPLEQKEGRESLRALRKVNKAVDRWIRLRQVRSMRKSA